MATFTSVGKGTVSPVMHVGGHRRLHLVGVGADKTAVAVRSTNPDALTAVLGVLYSATSGTFNVELRARKPGAAAVEARVKDRLVARLAVRVLEPLVLPPADTEPGLLARLLLAENKSPDDKGYNAGQSVTSMQWMRLVLVNRSRNHPGRFNAPGARSVRDIVTAPKQFEGFSQYPHLGGPQADRLARILAIANDDTDSRQERYATFVGDALDQAANRHLPPDPCPTGLYGWRTSGSGSPGGDFVPFGHPLSGNQFYTLRTKT